MEIEHWSHTHPLVLMDQEADDKSQRVKCWGCKEDIEGCSGYSCSRRCQFFLHKKCVELPPDIYHSLHKHPLSLLPSKGIPCNVCGDRDGGFLYFCIPCEFFLDIRCATHPQFVSGDLQNLSHSIHNHTLILIKDFHLKKIYQCGVCQKQISISPFYCCPDCRFYVHESCIELPPEINHPCHPKHPLTLLAKPPTDHHQGCPCYFCKEPWNGFVYYCSICKFGVKNIESSYALPQAIEGEAHEHPFTPFLKSLSFICDACGVEGDQSWFPYICAECSLIVHKKCISLQRTIKTSRHPHMLTHKYFFQKKEGKRNCSICLDGLDLTYGGYCCSENCSYFVHVDCALDEYFLEDENQSESFPCARKEIKHYGDEGKHFSHQHILLYNDRAHEGGKDCDGCMRQISTSFYNCAPCDFFLHRNCFELPTESRHWICKHLKILNFYEIFGCWYCFFYGSGFGYRCDSCERTMCIRCHEIPDICMTGRHKHRLHFNSTYTKDCSGCGSYIKFKSPGMFKCKRCNFALDHKCLTLPNSVSYKNDMHPLALCTSPDTAEETQFHCDICEKERDPNDWFYRCADCNVSTHIDCVLGMGPFVKLGKPFRFVEHKEHPVTFVKIDFNPPKCKECNKSCRDVAIQCTEASCNYIVHWHWRCLGIIANFTGYILHSS